MDTMLKWTSIAGRCTRHHECHNPKTAGATRRHSWKPIFFAISLFAVSVYPHEGRGADGNWHASALPKVAASGVPFEIDLAHPSGERIPYTLEITKHGEVVFTHEGTLPETIQGVKIPSAGRHTVTLKAAGDTRVHIIRSLPGVLTLLPPIMAILVALIFRQVIIALFMGVWMGAFFVNDFQLVRGFFYVVDHYTVDALAGESGADHVAVSVFTLLLGGMVGIFSKMGGTQGIVNKIATIATTPRRGQLSTWLMGIAIFFDDYTNTLIVGNTMRPLTDKLRISREKLSYIVDSTAAPVAAIGVISSWIGFEISLIKDAFDSLNVDRNPLTTFVSSIRYSYYPILTILFVLMIASTRRDFGPMLKAERRARRKGDVLSEKAVPISNIDRDITPAKGVIPRWYNAALPVATVVFGTIIGLVITGRSALMGSGQTSWSLMEAFRASNSFDALLWSSLSGCVVAFLLAVGQRLLTVSEAMNAWVAGMKSMFMAFIILLLAWSIGSVCVDLHTADYLVSKVSGVLSPHLLPALIFLIAALVSFATGTSWATMTILTPISIPLVFQVTQQNAVSGPAQEAILLSGIAAILAGSVFGDHCSPISDTTIMSSMASAADHIDHVRTQLPYALAVALIAIFLGYFPAAYRIPSPIVLLVGAAAVVGMVMLFGKPNETDGH
ncbi:MAG: Na+/H+ antiporter NhaC family protein [Candidatus Latescibacteria bacterium]|nr:Na+/H+ antiporter NhaC family protein [Candidatus Latescibacterota bacterium]NIO02901.1 Na+/H+ antiporter NhaC family protein [Candidatus Latescibacterota bacterium]NIO30036.1 Na+/H+ antiporter NhaC family protein [Candidatus Latescibacterota bacterium]NIO57651.1 Na+/H+ antiporter NhaC family protein [Candidatus Latescibacterota bacterium]NIT02818.1 Na+/H+ antiporter NhaC family protein [Candidatus Latescibacterota bacterium]